jgi:hypothetical protein
VVCGAGEGKRADLSTFDAVEDRHHLSIVRAIAPPLVLRAPEPGSEFVAPAAVRAAPGPPAQGEVDVGDDVDVVVIDAIEVPAVARHALDVPATRPPPERPARRASSSPLSRWPTRPTGSSGSYSSIGEAAPESIRPPAPASGPSIAPPRSLPPAAPRPLQRASTTRLPVVAAPKPAAPSTLVGPADVVGEKIPVLLVSPGELAKLPLDHRAGFVLSLLDGQTTVEGIVDASGMPTEEVLGIVAHLLEMSAIALR